MLTIATVNVNGVRAAFSRGMGDWLAARDPDVLALQEVRAPDEALAASFDPDRWDLAHRLVLPDGSPEDHAISRIIRRFA